MSAVPRSELGFAPVREADLPAVEKIERAIYDFPWTLGNFRDSLRTGYGFSGLWAGGELVGYTVVMHAAEEAHLLNLSVAARHQGRGLGRLLLEHAIERAGEVGARRLFLEVRPSNDAGRRLYAVRGFRQIGVRRGYYPAHGGREDALVLELEL